ncbi:Part of AAA domain-containing protein [Asanoa hainanensis]|uniref:Part of AAA domain-containing protein n=1 Tax=Asanoa hainanensis TaxID=560556 RepID=A0A239PFL1_9ACTN|nr:BREX system ATP-binding domain-containing protein [Asanoa hainanensis]SNT65812.1 Part of AAA domain-containing protein [Asanoa hainanensis]
MDLVGRRRELATVERALDRAARGHGELLVVTGPAGAGKTALADAAAELARSRGLRLVVVDDSAARLAGLAPEPGTVVVATSREPLGVGTEVRLGGLPEPELAELVGDLPADAVHALWLATGGLPGPALRLAAELAGSSGDAVVQLALATPSRAEFLELDAGLVRLLEEATTRPSPPATRARVLARLARELLGDPATVVRRQELIAEAVALARTAGPGVLAEVLDARLHALWDPAAAADRLATATEIVTQARAAGDARLELRGLFWTFVGRAELGDLAGAETALIAYARTGELAGDSEAAVVVLARQAMLATIRGRFDTADDLVAQVAERGRHAGVADTERLVATLRGPLDQLRGEDREVDTLRALARRLPGHFFEATLARVLMETGHPAEAELELARTLPAVLAGSGPRWLAAASELAAVAARSQDASAARALYDALLPYAGQLVVWGGANTISGPVDDYLGRLARRLDRPAEATAHLDRAVDLEERAGTLPWLAYSLAARAGAGDLARARSIAERLGLRGLLADLDPAPDEWSLLRDGDDWLLHAGSETARLRDGRGVHYLRTLLAAPGQELPALDLVAGGAGLRVTPEPVLDDAARAAYRRRVSVLDEQLAAADRAGDADRAAAVEAERTALVAELRRATGLGGRPRTVSDEAERARVNATRAVRTTVERIAAAAPLAGAHLRASLHTGRLFRYQPAPGGPGRWQL